MRVPGWAHGKEDVEVSTVLTKEGVPADRQTFEQSPEGKEMTMTKVLSLSEVPRKHQRNHCGD